MPNKPKQKVISVVFPPELYELREVMQERAHKAGMSASKYVLILIQQHVNAGKTLAIGVVDEG